MQQIGQHDLDKGLRLLRLAIDTHLITSHYALPLLIRQPGGRLIEMTDGTTAYNQDHYRLNVYYDLAKSAVNRIAWAVAQELAPHSCTALALTPGWMRSEIMLEVYGVTEANWRDALTQVPDFAISETPRYVGRAVAHLAADSAVSCYNGTSLASGELTKRYAVTDLDGSQPDAWRYIVEVREGGKTASVAEYR